MTNEELVWQIAYGRNDEDIPEVLLGESDDLGTLFKMIRVLAAELVDLRNWYNVEHSDE